MSVSTLYKSTASAWFLKVGLYALAGKIKADIKKSENKRVGFKVRTSVATASVRGTSGEIYSDGTLICLSGKWAITPPEPKGYKPQPTVKQKEDSDSKETEQTETTTQVTETEQTFESDKVVESEQTIVNADQDFYDAVDSGAFIVTENQTITISSEGKIVPPHEVAHSNSVHTGGIKSEEILENNSDLRISTPTKPTESSVTNKGKMTTNINVTISIE